MKSYYSAQRFSDAYEHARNVANFDQRYFQTENGPFEGTVRQVDLGGLHIFTERTNRQLVHRGQVMPGSIVLAWTSSASVAPGSWREETRVPLVGLSRGGSEWILHRPSDTELDGITMSAVEFDRLIDALGVTTTRNENRHIQFMRGGTAFSVLRSGIREMSWHAERFSCADARATIRKQLVDAIFCALGEAEARHRTDVTHLTYNDMVKRCHDLILGNPEFPLTVLDLCTELRVCRSTLQTSFLKVTGQSPLSYLRRMRLCGVRRLLRSTSTVQMTIGDAASRWGFVHLGRFATDYRELFGELPSRTLRPGAEN
ncbi:helix-turn-helix domain-containing protein [Noviherbaspirillum saxi]|uniref:Helix-turn-helix domain-containing protein n=1 Tax=Noviherbaspirillum saxi TaxID=2320863 RepID=A0A3A3FSP7_9BURK|nr:helix-turn-helix domain-containing protein [Noviherbaspirillum saxi]RJF98550.1 helix-turn-helix domain-containing protein [Noviherbaspirillum saxi]